MTQELHELADEIELELSANTDPVRHAVLMNALTLARVLSSVWIRYVRVFKGESKQDFMMARVVGPAGLLFGKGGMGQMYPGATMQRLSTLLQELGINVSDQDD